MLCQEGRRHLGEGGSLTQLLSTFVKDGDDFDDDGDDNDDDDDEDDNDANKQCHVKREAALRRGRKSGSTFVKGRCKLFLSFAKFSILIVSQIIANHCHGLILMMIVIMMMMMKMMIKMMMMVTLMTISSVMSRGQAALRRGRKSDSTFVTGPCKLFQSFANCSKAVQLKYRCSAKVVKMQCKCGANAVQMQCKCSENAVQMQCKCSANVLKMQCSISDDCFPFQN